MIEINLHPAADKRKGGDRGGPSFELPEFGDFAGLETLRSDPWQTAMIAVVVLVPLVVGGLWFLQRSDEQAIRQRLEAAREDSARLAELRVLNDSLVERRRQIRERVQLVKNLDGGRFVWPHLLDEVSRALPEFAWITGIRRESREPVLRVSMEGVAATPIYITQFMRNLEGSPYVGEVQFRGSNRTTANGLPAHQFRVILTYAEPPPDAIRTEPLLGGS